MPVRRLLAVMGTAIIVLLAALSIARMADGFPGRYHAQDRALALFDRADAAGYVKRRFDSLLGAPFAANGRPRVLLVGDSFAKDLLNSLHETGLDEKLDLAVWELRPGCGNLAQQVDYSRFLSPAEVAVCDRTRRWAAPELMALAQQADVIWLASAWHDWEAPHLAQSIELLEGSTDARFLVSGRKSVGQIDIPTLVRAGRDARASMRGTYPHTDRRIDAVLARTLPQQVWVPIGERFCDPRGACPLFDQYDRLLSFDGAHLTPAGAARMGRLLRADPRVSEALQLRSDPDRLR